MKINIQEVAAFINAQGPDTKVYLRADSERILVDDRYVVDYMLVVVVHINGCNGAKVFGEIQREQAFDKDLSKPKTRLITEVYKVANLYLELEPLIAHDISIHLDLNPSDLYGSSCVISEAVGYIKGVCGIQPKVKPEAWAASSVSDQLKRILC